MLTSIFNVHFIHPIEVPLIMGRNEAKMSPDGFH